MATVTQAMASAVGQTGTVLLKVPPQYVTVTSRVLWISPDHINPNPSQPSWPNRNHYCTRTSAVHDRELLVCWIYNINLNPR